MTTSYVVTAPAAVVPDRDGVDRYFYRDAVIRPGEFDTDRLEQLVDEGYLAHGDEVIDTAVGDVTGSTVLLERPSKGALKPDWVAYAVQQGLDPAEAEKANKADLVALYVDGTPLPTATNATPPADPVIPETPAADGTPEAPADGTGVGDADGTAPASDPDQPPA